MPHQDGHHHQQGMVIVVLEEKEEDIGILLKSGDRERELGSSYVCTCASGLLSGNQCPSYLIDLKAEVD